MDAPWILLHTQEKGWRQGRTLEKAALCCAGLGEGHSCHCGKGMKPFPDPSPLLNHVAQTSNNSRRSENPAIPCHRWRPIMARGRAQRNTLLGCKNIPGPVHKRSFCWWRAGNSHTRHIKMIRQRVDGTEGSGSLQKPHPRPSNMEST